MNVNCKLSLTDAERNQMHNRLTGTATKKMVSRADVNNWVKDQIERLLKVGSPGTEQIKTEVKPLDKINFDDVEPGEIMEVMRQNELLLTRVNRLQFMLDRSK